jgi:GMP synthase (glutamine-hydrolysing)
MRIHYLQHVPFEGLGSIAAWATANHHDVSSTRFFLDDPLPNLNDLDWLVLMGGPMGVHDEALYPWLASEKRFIGEAIEGGKVVLGICLGAQLIADVLGARVFPNRHKEIGWFPIEMGDESQGTPLFRDFPQRFEVFHWHGDTFDLPAGALPIARSAACENQGFVFRDRVVALQFHLETTRAGAEELIAHCSEELVDAPFIQTPRAMLANEARFGEVNAKMRLLLDRLAAC